MKKRMLLLILCCFMFSTISWAIPVPEILGNNSYDNPMNLNPYFSVEPNPEIQGADLNYPWVSVLSSGIAGKHFFSFNAAATTYYFDVDHSTSDMEMGVWNGTTGQLVGWNDDHSPADTGSGTFLDPWIELMFDIPTLVVVGLSKWPSSGGDNGIVDGNLLGDGDRYVLNISGDFDLSAAPVPEPATMLLLGLGLVGIAGFRRKKC